MPNTRFLHAAFACAAVLASSTALAQPADMDWFTCNVPKEGMESALGLVARHNAIEGDETQGYFIAGPVREQGLCVQNIRLIGAFGVLAVSSELCNAKPQPMLEWLATKRAELLKTGFEKQPGVLAAFGKQDGESFTIYNGLPSFPAKPDPNHKTVSFTCITRLGDSK